MKILPAESGDLERIFGLYDKAIEFQKQVFDKHWLSFEADLVDRQIAEGRLWKITENGEIACIYSVAYEDPTIWGENSGDSSMYIHRIVTNPEFRGCGYAGIITEWAKGHACDNGLRFVRMDTWGDNRKLIDYYQDCGFKFIGLMTPEESETLPKHYSGISLSLFEIDLENDKTPVQRQAVDR